MGKSRAMRPTRDQKVIMSAAGLVVNNWLVLRETPVELRLVSRGIGTSRTIKKDQCGGNRRRSK